MTTETRQFVFAGGDTCYGGQGRVWYIKSAPTGPLTIICRKSGQGSTNVRAFTSMPAGAKFKAEMGDGWDILEIQSATAQIVELILGDDDVEIATAVSVTGNAATVEQPSGTISTPASATILTGAQANIAANLSRRRITIFNWSGSTTSFYVRDTTATTDAGVEIQPGMGYTFSTTASLRIVNNSGATVTYTTFEES